MTHPIPLLFSIICVPLIFGASRTLDHLDLRLNHGEIIGTSLALLERTGLVDQTVAFSLS